MFPRCQGSTSASLNNVSCAGEQQNSYSSESMYTVDHAVNKIVITIYTNFNQVSNVFKSYSSTDKRRGGISGLETELETCEFSCLH